MEIPEATPHPIYRAELLQIIQSKIDEHPRSAQVQIGPSEVGGCATKVAWKVTYGGDSDRQGGWAAHKGTVLHAWLDEVFKTTDQLMPDGSQRFFSDMKVPPVTDMINGGTLDLYDLKEQMVVDWKLPGEWSFKQVRDGKVSPGYYVQANLYGFGMEMAGWPVTKVAIMWLPMATDELHGTARGAVLKVWPYSREVALSAIRRLADIKKVVAEHGMGKVIEQGLLEKTSDFCSGCPAFHTNTDRRAICQGVTGRAVKDTSNPFA